MATKLILYDIPRKVPQGISPAWSHNTLKTRFALLYKRLPFTTEWIEYPDIAPTFKRLGIPAASSPPPYTVPAIIDKSSTDPPAMTMDSLEIANYLDKTYPSRPLFRGSSAESIVAQQDFIQLIFTHCASYLSPLIVPCAAKVLQDGSAEYFRTTREARFGCPLDQVLADPDKLEEHWQELNKGLSHLDSVLKEAEGRGVDIVTATADGGAIEPTYCGLVLAATFAWLKRVGPEGAWERIMETNDGRWEAIWQDATPYMEEGSDH